MYVEFKVISKKKKHYKNYGKTLQILNIKTDAWFLCCICNIFKGPKIAANTLKFTVKITCFFNLLNFFPTHKNRWNCSIAAIVFHFQRLEMTFGTFIFFLFPVKDIGIFNFDTIAMGNLLL